MFYIFCFTFCQPGRIITQKESAKEFSPPKNHDGKHLLLKSSSIASQHFQWLHTVREYSLMWKREEEEKERDNFTMGDFAWCHWWPLSQTQYALASFWTCERSYLCGIIDTNIKMRLNWSFHFVNFSGYKKEWSV